MLLLLCSLLLFKVSFPSSSAVVVVTFVIVVVFVTFVAFVAVVVDVLGFMNVHLFSMGLQTNRNNKDTGNHDA